MINQDTLSYGNFKLDNKSLPMKKNTTEERYEINIGMVFRKKGSRKRQRKIAKVFQWQTRGEKRELEKEPRPLISGYLNY